MAYYSKVLGADSLQKKNWQRGEKGLYRKQSSLLHPVVRWKDFWGNTDFKKACARTVIKLRVAMLIFNLAFLSKHLFWWENHAAGRFSSVGHEDWINKKWWKKLNHTTQTSCAIQSSWSLNIHVCFACSAPQAAFPVYPCTVWCLMEPVAHATWAQMHWLRPPLIKKPLSLLSSCCPLLCPAETKHWARRNGQPLIKFPLRPSHVVFLPVFGLCSFVIHRKMNKLSGKGQEYYSLSDFSPPSVPTEVAWMKVAEVLVRGGPLVGFFCLPVFGQFI